jgi:hypothetical protein
MSSPKAAAQTTGARKAKRRSATRPKATRPATSLPTGQALKLAQEMERGLADGRLDVVSDAAQQHLMAALCKIYSQRVQAGEPSLLLHPRSGVSPTDVMITASGLLRAADLQVFELGMWQSWTGR